MVIYLMATGRMIRLTALEHITMLTGANMKECGLTTCKMEKGKKPGKINLPTRVNTNEVKNMVKASMCGRMEAYIVDLGLTTKFTETAPINGLTAEFM